MASLAVFGLLFYVGLLAFVSSAAVGKGGIVGEGQGTLVFSHVIFRHGDRSPHSFYPTDPYNNPSEWPVGPGQLSNTGKTQHYKYGKWLRGRYDTDFLPEQYSEQNIYVRSTDMDRTIASALCNLAGIYQPTGDQIWQKSIQWQPIPVHTVAASDDWLLGGSLPSCPVYEKALAEVYASADVQNIITAHSSEIDYIVKNSGGNLNADPIGKLGNVMQVRDSLFIETLYKKTLPTWTKSIYPSDWIDRASKLLFVLPSYNPQLAKFRIGYFLKDILDRSTSKVNGTLSPNLSLYMYSAHDSNIASVLMGLGMWDNNLVQYAASILFEVRVHENLPFMEIFYKRSADIKTPELMFIPNCGYTCPLQKMYEIYDNILPKNDFKTECDFKT